MMKSSLRFIVAVLFTGLVAISLTACGGGGDDDGDEVNDIENLSTNFMAFTPVSD